MVIGRIHLATGGFRIVHMTDRPLAGAGMNFDRRRNGFAPTSVLPSRGGAKWEIPRH